MKQITAKLVRTEIGCFGAFGVLDLNGTIFTTCERAYQRAPESKEWFTKIPPGKFKCVRGVHQLTTGGPFVTFEVTGVKGHSGLLFHAGNTYRDSHGCILLGHSGFLLSGIPGVSNSKASFLKFMEMLNGVDPFELEVVNAYQSKH